MSKTRLYIGGTFDCLHSGHINLFKRAKKLGKVIVAINTDEFATEYKRKPLIPLKDRIAVISQLRCVDRVVINKGDSKVTIKQTRPTHIIHGDDWTGDSLMTQMGLTQEFMTKYKIKFKYFPYTPDVSTTKIRNL
jgi:glycerol-3-phosphate cytidylyltransferase